MSRNPSTSHTSSKITSVPFKPGTRIDVLEVAHCSPSRFVLFDPARSTLLLVLSGLVALVLGIVAIGGIQNFFSGAGSRAVLTGRAIVGSLAALAYGVVALSWLTRLGFRISIETKPRQVTLDRLYFLHQRWTASDLAGVVFVVYKANSDKADSDDLQQSAEVMLIDPNDRFVASLGDTSIKLNDMVPLAQSGIHAARLLRLPIWIDRRGKPMAANLKEAIQTIESSDVFQPREFATPINKPWISVLNLAVTAATVLVVSTMASLVATKWNNPGKTESLAEALSGAARSRDAVGANGPAGVQAGGGRAESDPDLLLLDKNLADMQSINRETRMSAAWDLMSRKVGPRRDDVRQAASLLLEDPEEEAQKRALRLLGRWGTAEDVTIVAKLIHDPSQSLRAEALQALGQLQQMEGIAPILERFRVKDDRSIAAAALKVFGKTASSEVVPLLDDPDREVQLEAARVLEQIATRDTIPALQAAFNRYKEWDSFPTQDEFNNPTAQQSRQMASTLKNALQNAATR